MQRHLKKILIAIAVLIALGFPMVQAEQSEVLLHWKNGDRLPGQLSGSGSGTIHWASPYFLDDLVLDVNVLNSVVFPKPSVLTTEAFRVDAVSGDVWMADLIDSDDDTFLFSSNRHGQFRVKRSAIHRLDRLQRQERHDSFFDGSQLANWWNSSKRKKDMTDLSDLFFGDIGSNWYADAEGHPRTNVAKAKIFHARKWLQGFEVELELTSTTQPPNFVFAFGEDLYQALRLEIWEDELVAVQGTLFKSVLSVQPEQRRFRLRLTYDQSTNVLKISDFAENLLLRLEGVKPTTQRPGLYIENRGKDLTVRRLSVYRRFAMPTAQQLDLSKPRVYMRNGEVIQGKLFVQKDKGYVLDTDGTRRDVDLLQVTRAVQPGIPMITSDQPITLEYPGGVVLRGKLVKVNPDSVLLQTAFADEPITCSFVNASRLRFETDTPLGDKEELNVETDTPLIRADKEELNADRLFYASSSLRGRVLFDGKDASSLIQWESVGALKPVRLADNQATRMERSLQSASEASSHFDTAQFSHTLHLQSGEIVPCQIISSDGTTLSFQSPFMGAQHMDLTNLKALEFADRTHAVSRYETRPKDDKYSLSITAAKWDNGLKDAKIQKIVLPADGEKFVINNDNIQVIDGRMVLTINEGGLKQQPAQDWVEFGPGVLAVAPSPSKQDDKKDVKLERALTVPNFSRDTPPHHILMANNGDMKRGKLLSFNGQAIQFDSKLRTASVPMDRVARVVNVSKPETRPDDAPKAKLCVKLTDGSILVFEPLEVKNNKLLGRSPIYGAVSVPVESIQHLYFGERAKFFKDAFEEWVVRPAKSSADSGTP